MIATKPVADRGFIRAMKYDYLGEVSTEVNFRLQSYLTFQPEVAAKAREFAALEAQTRDMISHELARHGVLIEHCYFLRAFSWVLRALTLIVIPLKLVLPTRLWVRLIYRSTLHALELYQSQERRWGALNPDFFARLIDHEVKQRDWAHDYLQRGK